MSKEKGAAGDGNIAGRLQRLESWVEFVSQHGARPPIFLAKRGATDLQWQERTIVTTGGTPTIVDFDDGRACTNDADTEAIVDTADSLVLLEVLEGNATRYIKIRDQGAGELFGMIEYTGAQWTSVWGWAPVVNVPPV